MKLIEVENKLYEIRDLIELAQFDHPEDYNLDAVHQMINELIMEIE